MADNQLDADRLVVGTQLVGNEIEAYALMHEVQDWIDEGYGFADDMPTANLTLTRTVTVVSVDDLVVWSSEQHDTEQLTLEFVKQQLAEHFDHYKPLLPPYAKSGARPLVV